MAWLVRDGEVLSSLEMAESRSARARGLLGRDGIDGALMIPRTRSVHSFGMRFDIDVAFLDAEFKRVGKGKFSAQVVRVSDSLLMAREMFPGKANSLDALCKRLEVDNSQRGLHGALLDAGLLAEVYLRMTRGQGTLVIDDSGGSHGAGSAVNATSDLRLLVLTVHVASEEERAAHEAMLVDLDKASGGEALWRRVALIGPSVAGETPVA